MNAGMTPEEVTERLQLAMDRATGLPPEGIVQIEMLIRVGERLVAFEALCRQIDEYEISLDPDLVQQLIEVGLAVGAEERYSDLLMDTQVPWHRSALPGCGCRFVDTRQSVPSAGGCSHLHGHHGVRSGDGRRSGTVRVVAPPTSRDDRGSVVPVLAMSACRHDRSHHRQAREDVWELTIPLPFRGRRRCGYGRIQRSRETRLRPSACGVRGLF